MECDRLNISRVFLIAPGDPGGNDLLERELEKHPDRLCGFAMVDWGDISPTKVEQFKERGFTGLKFTRPPANYNDERWYPIYEVAERLKMPGLFHLGIVSRTSGKALTIGGYQGPATPESAREKSYVDCNMMRPILIRLRGPSQAG